MTFSVRYKKILTKQISDAIDKTSTVAWAGRYKRDWQEWVGKFVGRVMAHETYHTIWALDAKTGRSWAPHLGTGNLEDEGGGSSPYRKENTVSFSNVARYRVLTQFETLRKMHSRFESYPIDRGSPSMLDIQLPQDKVKTKEWERRLKEYLE